MPFKKEEKRRFPRIALKTPLNWKIRGMPQSNSAINNDISLGGIGFIDDKFVAANTCVNIQLNVAARVVNVMGKIANISFLPYSDKYRLGVEFMEFDSNEKKFLSDYINEQFELKGTSL